MKKRIDSLNIVRIIAAIGILLYHTYWNFGCTYGKANYLISQSTFHMTTFFVLSGFVIYYSINDKDFFSKPASIFVYIKKRFMSLFPEYFLIYTVFYYLMRDTTTLNQDIAAFPFQLTMTFGFEFYGHLINWGGWFFSLIFLCYIVAPYFSLLIKNMGTKCVAASIFMSAIFIIFSPFLGVNVYNNFFCRFFEFYIGMSLCYLFIREDDNSLIKKKSELEIIGITIFLYIMAFFIIYKCQILFGEIGWNHTNLAPINIIFSGVIIYIFAHATGRISEILFGNVLIKTIANYSMEIWCATFFSSYIWNVFWNGKYIGVKNILLAIGLNTLFTILLALYRVLIGNVIKYSEKIYWIYVMVSFGVVASIKIFSLL